ncbi:protein kinase domain-containing protein [Planotetraspora silvatica]|uniref:protein kinase domain-containing protein n=1 Tax=Planotetraspora silvatica TaxID=234614 RepID=UPI001EF29F64|nr:transporter substrate-binding domain-containing protein [Planotetraspora silvatica]
MLTGRIGEGGQGVVYLGENEAGDRAAVKLLHIKFSGDTIARSRFARELKAAQRVAGFCTARVIAADLDGDTPYIASEYIDGRSLRETVESYGPLNGAALERLAVGTATALIAIHRAGIVHRDFKPDNVLIAEDGPRVVDFGIARIVDSTGTVTSRAVGTPAYMAPEQISGEPVGPPADVFAWGSTMAFAATGTAVFGGSSIAAVLNRILNHDIDVSVLPERIRDVVNSCLTKSAASRPTAEQLLLRLLGHAESPGPSTGVLSAVEPEASENAGMTAVAASAGATVNSGGGSGQDRPSGPADVGPGRESTRDLTAEPVALPVAEPVALPIAEPAAPPIAEEEPAETTSPDWIAIFRGSPAIVDRPRPPASAGSRAPTEFRTGSPPGGHGGRPRPRSKGGRARWIAVATAAVALAATGAVVLSNKIASERGGGADPTGISTSGPPAAALVPVIDKARSTHRLTIAVKGDLPGVGLETGGAFTGFEVDVATYIAGKLGVPASGITFRRVARSERTGALKNGDADMVLATYSYDENKGDGVTFAGPYYTAHADVLVREDSGIRGLKDLAGHVLCAPQGTDAYRVVERTVGGAEAGGVEGVPAANYAVCMDLLAQGRVDGVPGDDLILAGFADRAQGMDLAVLGVKLTDQRYSVGLPPKDARTCAVVRDAIAEMYADGTMKTLAEKHFSHVRFDLQQKAPPVLSCD